MQVAFEQCGVDDLQELFAALDSGGPLHKRRGSRRLRVVQLLHQVAAFLQCVTVAAVSTQVISLTGTRGRQVRKPKLT